MKDLIYVVIVVSLLINISSLRADKKELESMVIQSIDECIQVHEDYNDCLELNIELLNEAINEK